MADRTIDKDEAAKVLARKHYQIEDGITHIYRLTDKSEVEVRPTEPIKLLEVNAATVPSGVMPLHFGPAPASGVPFPSVIVEVTPAEFEKIRRQELQLPRGWVIGEEIPRPAAVRTGSRSRDREPGAMLVPQERPAGRLRS